MSISVKYEIERTSPDYVVFVPGSLDGSSGDTGNEHFLVFDGLDGSLIAVWTQSTIEGHGDQKIVFVRSVDNGETWSPPKCIAGRNSMPRTKMASWAFPMVSRSGRIYVLFNRHIGMDDIFTHTTGMMSGTYSDDNGETWSDADDIPMEHNQYDNPDPDIPANWIIWQKPERLSNGKYLAGFTHWLSPTVSNTPVDNDDWRYDESVVEFMRFENIDMNPSIANIEVSRFPGGDQALYLPTTRYSGVSILQEPSLVALPDARLFCTMRTVNGYPAWSVSSDAGETWSDPKPMRYSDDGEIMEHPLSPCPIYQLGNGTYIFLFHNHPGMDEPDVENLPRGYERTPLCVAHGEFQADGSQPIWFSAPIIIMDSKHIGVGFAEGRSDLAMYASLTTGNGQDVLWYPDRKFYLLGKKICSEWFSGSEKQTHECMASCS